MPEWKKQRFNVESENGVQQNLPDQNNGSYSDSERESNSRHDRNNTSWFPNMCHFENMKHFQFGENFDLFCRRYVQFISLNKLQNSNLYMHFLQMLDDKTYQKLVDVELNTAEKRYAALFCRRYFDEYYPKSTKNCLQNEILDCKQDINECIDEYSLRLKANVRIAFPENCKWETNCL